MASGLRCGMRMLESLLRWFSPFRLMRDVSRGTREERLAAYRHNRRRRGDLRVCMGRWALVLTATALLTERLDTQGLPRVFVYLSAVCATFLVCGLCVLLTTAYVYVYLTSHEG